MYAIVDCNNFYASCERVFNPKLIGKPVVVLSNNDGCVIARSNEAKALGIEMGAPAFFMEELLKKHKVAVFSSNYTLYGDMSQRVMKLLANFAQEVEIYSIDEAFLSLHGYTFNLEEHAQKIRQTVTQGTGIPVSIGIAPTKTLAKIANRFVKKNPALNGVFALDTKEKITDALKNTHIGDVWGIGGQYAKMLNIQNVFTAYDFIQLPDAWVREKMTIVGLRTKHELSGKPCIPLELVPPSKKGICTSRSFGQLLTDYEPIAEAASAYAARCAEKLRSQKSCANSMLIFLHTNQFRTQDAQYLVNSVINFPIPTNSTIEITKYALFALKQIYKPGYNYKKVGIIVNDLVPANQIQTGLFDRVNRDKHSKLMDIMDKVNRSVGKEKLKLAIQGKDKIWKLRQEKLSPHYTTRWDEILTIRN